MGSLRSYSTSSGLLVFDRMIKTTGAWIYTPILLLIVGAKISYHLLQIAARALIDIEKQVEDRRRQYLRKASE